MKQMELSTSKKSMYPLMGDYFDNLPFPVFFWKFGQSIAYVNKQGNKLINSYFPESAGTVFLLELEKFVNYNFKNKNDIPIEGFEKKFSYKGHFSRPILILVSVQPYKATWSGDDLYILNLFFNKESVNQIYDLSLSEKSDYSDFDNLPVEISILDVDMKFLYVNKEMVDDSKLRKWIIGKTILEYVQYLKLDSGFAEKWRQAFQEVLRIDAVFSFESEIVQERTMKRERLFLRPVKDLVGHIKHVVCVSVSMDEEGLQELFISKHKSVAIEVSIDGIALLDSNSLYYYLNKSHVEMYGYSSSEELIGKSWEELYTIEERDRITKEIFPLMGEKGCWSGITTGKKADGSLIITEITLTSLPEGHLLCICRNISAKNQQDLEMKRLALVASKSNSIVIITDSAGGVDWVNESFVKVTGYELNEIRGQNLYGFLSGQETDFKTQQKILHSLNNKLSFSGDVLSYFKNNSEAWFHLESTPVFDTTGGFQNFVCVATDISLLKEADKNIRISFEKEKELSQLKSQFVSLASHEFRTPLSGILSSKEIIVEHNQQSGSPNERINFHCSRISAEVSRMTEIMNEILLMEKLDAGRMVFTPAIFCLLEFTEKQIEQILFKFPEYSIDFKVKGDVIPVNMDSNLFEHIYTNLFSNALKYSLLGEKNPNVTLIYGKENIEIIVKDYGIGIPVKEQPHLFTSFFRASNTLNIQGSGLGLVIVKQFVDLHEGQIFIKSSEGEGCEVLVKIPYK